MNGPRTFGALAMLALAAGHGCFGSGANERSTPGGTGGEAGDAINVGVGGGVGGDGGACVDVVVAADVTQKPVDIVMMVDNSGSMFDEVEGVEANINVNFANILEGNGVDYRVIMITDHGPERQFSKNVCIGPPLSQTSDCNGPPGNVPGQFYHYDIHVESHDAVCQMFASMFGNAPDEWGLAPNGWNSWLRTDALKVFIVVTDDKMGCPDDAGDIATGAQAAIAFDDQLRTLNPAQFGGSAAERNYVFYSIVGLASKADPFEAYDATEPVIVATCTSATSAGTGYQSLSNMTGALRFPVCSHQSYDAVFEHIAASVIDVSAIPCQLDLPEPPPGERLDLNAIEVLFTSSGGSVEEWHVVASPDQCDATAFYIDPLGTTIHLCPAACAKVQADLQASLEVRIPCGSTAE